MQERWVWKVEQCSPSLRAEVIAVGLVLEAAKCTVALAWLEEGQ